MQNHPQYDQFVFSLSKTLDKFLLVSRRLVV